MVGPLEPHAWDVEGPIRAEIFLVWLDGNRLELAGPDGPRPWIVQLDDAEHPVEVVDRIVTGSSQHAPPDLSAQSPATCAGAHRTANEPPCSDHHVRRPAREPQPGGLIRPSFSIVCVVAHMAGLGGAVRIPCARW